MPGIESFDSAESAATAAATALGRALRGKDRRTFVATGGRTPGPAYDALSAMDLGWRQVTVTQTDERFVDPAAPESNAGLIRTRLLTGRAALARFLPLKGDGPTPDSDAQSAEAWLAPLLPAAATLLGMGDDGHIGSLFPGDPQLARWLDPDGARLVIGVAVAGEPPHVPRISLTLSALLRSRLIALLATGEGKRRLLERALANPDPSLPVSAVLHQARAPVRIFWAP